MGHYYNPAVAWPVFILSLIGMVVYFSVSYSRWRKRWRN